MKELQKYSFDLPARLIAQEPVHPRDHARLLVYHLNDGMIEYKYFYDLPEILPATTTLVINNSKVARCRWLFDNGKIEVFVIEKTDDTTIRAMVRPGKKFKVGTTVQLAEGLHAEIVGSDTNGIRTLRLNIPHDDKRLNEYEHVPLPPYIAQDDQLAAEYQTVYAKPLGSLAAPTAGLHFTDELLSKLRAGFSLAEITLHVGLGTFAKLTEHNLLTNTLHEEQYSISNETAELLNKSTHITAVGTTVARTLETNRREGEFRSTLGATDIFIRPGHSFKAVNSLITNFHLPSTSLLMLVAAFMADKKKLNEDEAAAELMRIYQHAITKGYRFYSFGDAMIII